MLYIFRNYITGISNTVNKMKNVSCLQEEIMISQIICLTYKLKYLLVFRVKVQNTVFCLILLYGQRIIYFHL